MHPIDISPISPEYRKVVYAKDQPQYIPLPAIHKDDGRVITCWRLSWRERATILCKGRIYLTMLTFNQPLQPVKLGVTMPVGD